MYISCFLCSCLAQTTYHKFPELWYYLQWTLYLPSWSGIPRNPPPPHLSRPWQSRTSLWSLWGGTSNRLHPATPRAAGRAAPSFTAGVPVSMQHPSSTTLCWGAAATVRGSEAPGQGKTWQASGEGGNGKAAGDHDECTRGWSGREGWWNRASAAWSPASTSKSCTYSYSFLC